MEREEGANCRRATIVLAGWYGWRLQYWWQSLYIRASQASSPHTHSHTGVPQGSGLDPILFSFYMSPVSSITQSFSVGIQQYVDNTQFYIALFSVDLNIQLALLSSRLSDLLCITGSVTMVLLSVAPNLSLFLHFCIFASAVYATANPSVCPSICPSHSGIVL